MCVMSEDSVLTPSEMLHKIQDELEEHAQGNGMSEGSYRAVSDMVMKQHEKTKDLETAYVESAAKKVLLEEYLRQAKTDSHGIIGALCELAKQKTDDLKMVVESTKIVGRVVEDAKVVKNGSYVQVTLPVDSFEYIKYHSKAVSEFDVDNLESTSKYLGEMQKTHEESYERGMKRKREEEDKKREEEGVEIDSTSVAVPGEVGGGYPEDPEE